MPQDHPTPRLYADLVRLWPLVSPPGDYVEELESFRDRYRSRGVPDGARLLHLGCGGGSLDFHLKRSYAVTGVDISEAMLGIARGLNPDVRYLVGDIRDVRLGEIFDAVLVHDAISYMTSTEELGAVYRTAAAHLGLGGVMIALPEEIRPRLSQNRTRSETHADGETTLTLIQVDHDEDPADNRYESVFIYLIREGAEVRVEMDRHVVGVFELEEFVSAIERAGFQATVEPWELSEWEPGEVPMPLIVATKTEAGG